MTVEIVCPASGLRVDALLCADVELCDGYCNPICTPAIRAGNEFHSEILAEVWQGHPDME